MKKRLTAMLVCILLVLSFLPATALAADANGDGYNDNDYDKLKAFLDQTSADGIHTNGWQLGGDAYGTDPSTWGTTITWLEVTGEKYAYALNWNNKSLSGTLDVSNFAQLSALYARNNRLTELNVTNDSLLGQIDVPNNQITALDLSTNSGLGYLFCNGNKLTTLNTTAAGNNLYEILCYGNNLTSLTVSGNNSLVNLYCSENELTELNANGLSSMTTLACDYNALEKENLNLTGCSALTELYCNNNALTALTLDDCVGLQTLYCGDNQLTSLELSAFSTLAYLGCSGNKLTSFSVGANLESLDCSNCGLTTLDLSALTKLTDLNCSGNTLTSFNVGTQLEELDCSNCGFTELDLSTLTKLTKLNCSGNTLTSLNLGTTLRSLDCSNCGFTTLDLSTLTALKYLTCNDNSLTSLDLTKNTLLEDLAFSGNKLASYSVGTTLRSLDCSNCGFTTLDLSKLTALKYLTCNDNSLTSLDLTNNPDMFCLDVKGNPLKQIDASIDGASISLTAKDGGYAELYYDGYEPTLYATAVPVSPAAFYNWTSGAAEAATTAKYDLPASTNVDLDANFLLLTGSLSDGKIKCGSSITLTPSIAGGTWAFDSAYLSRSGNVFTGIKPGTTQVTYTMNSKSTTFNLTISQGIAVGLSCTKTDASVYGGADGSVTITATGGDSGAYEYSLGGAWQKMNVFTGLAAGTYTATVRDAANASNTASCSVTISQPSHMGIVPAKKMPSKINAGTAVTLTPPAAPRGYTLVSVTYSSSKPTVATVDANGNVTFLAGGKAKIITKSVYQMTNRKGKIKTKTITVRKTVTVKQPVASIMLNQTNATVVCTQKLKLAAVIAPSTASIKKLRWKSSNPKVASVSSAGVVKGKSAGTAVITCTAKDGSGATVSCTVTVTPIQPTGLKLSKTVLTMKTGRSASIKATVLPKKTDFKTVTFISSNPAVATVNAKGKVKAVAPGTVTITAVTSNGLAASCTITVS